MSTADWDDFDKLKDFPKIIKTERLVLRALHPDDAVALFNLVNAQRGHIGKYLDWPERVKTLEDEEKYVAARMAAAAGKTGFDWVIETPAGKMIGYIGTDPVSKSLWMREKSDIDWENKTVSFAFFMDEAQTGKGYMTEALQALISVAAALGFARAEIHTDPENAAAVAVARKCGMRAGKPAGVFVVDLEKQAGVFR
ncbi:MAG: GNAT family N-acetyltransferase [Proteobacteria bacterium]|nr:GNAT family N-acetyltransferase [Pseudomonadota bacterium]